MKLRNAIVALVICVFMCGPACMVGAKSFGMEVPEALSNKEAEFLAGGIVETDLKSATSIEGFASRTFQKQLEDVINNNVPAKSTALLSTAAIQRSLIEASNAVFQFETYATYFGGDVTYIAENSALGDSVLQRSWSEPGVRAYAEGVARVAQARPQVQFGLYLVEDSKTSKANPAAKYTPDYISTQEIFDVMNSAVQGIPNVKTAVNTIDTVPEFYENYYKSDLHWNAHGSLRGYRTMAAMLGKPGNAPVSVVPVAGTPFAGFYSRNGLDIIEDIPLGYDAPWLNDITLYEGDITYPASQHPVYDGSTDQEKYWNFYGLYFRNAWGVQGSGTGNMLLIGDSMADAVKPLLGHDYEWITSRRDMHGEYSSTERLIDLIDQTGCDTVLFIGRSLNVSNFVTRNPNYFNL